jgi:cytochrome o ubiquinol oxidase subunit 1
MPLQIRARDVSFPVMNSVSLGLTAAGAAIIMISLVIGSEAGSKPAAAQERRDASGQGLHRSKWARTLGISIQWANGPHGVIAASTLI